MKIQDMSNAIFDASSKSDVERILLKRYGRGVNAFWIYHEQRKHLCLIVLVNNELANLNYLPDDGDHPGFHSIGTIPSLPAHEYTTFYMNSPNEPEEVPNDAIVPFADAMAAAKEFLLSPDLPQSIKWFEL
jgi:Immunity protein Imm1